MPAEATHALRRLGPGDVTLFEALMTMFGEVFDEPETYTAKRPGRAWVENRLADDDFIALAAVAGDTVVGGLAAYVLRKFEQERSEIYIYDLAVVESYRRRGIATALIEKVRELAPAHRAYLIMIQADKGDTPPIALYSKLGRREEVLHFDIDVPGEEPA